MQAKIYNFQHYLHGEVIHTPVTLKHRLTEMLNQSGFNVLDLCEHKFQPQGYTCLWLLGESHLAIHTFPEEGVAYLELSSCVQKPFDLFVKKYLSKFE